MSAACNATQTNKTGHVSGRCHARYTPTPPSGDVAQ